MSKIKDNITAFNAAMDYIANHDGLQPERKRYAPYLPHDRKFMEREGEPCRNCLRPFNDHHNGQCPKDEEVK